MATQRPLTVAFDIGGTFTDIVLLQPDGSVVTDKVLSAPAILLPTVRRRIEEALHGSGRSQLTNLLHATTIASNVLLEGKGPAIGLLTTTGFRDELEIRRESRPSIYDFSWQRTPPLIPRRRRMQVTERIDARGDVVTPLDMGETSEALCALRKQGVEALAICFVNSYVNPAHEKAARELAQELLPDVIVCTSHEVLPQIREYERMSTTCVNASLMPVIHEYLDDMERELGSYSATFRIMQSNGGMMTLGQARRSPIHMVESGPASGVLAAAALAREVGIRRAVSFDMGGTTVKACLIEDSTPIEKTDYEVGGEAHVSARYNHGVGYALSVPSFDIVEAGAGGGSIARIQDGALRVGPASAGAVPGPVAYGRGGTAPTVTDANVVLGFMNPHFIAGGTVAIDREAAGRALDRALGPHLQRGTPDIAYGVFQVANAAMMRTIRAVTTERGRDPRDYTMVAFGGSGPVHAAALADMLGIKRVYIPLFPGLFSAVGLLLADVRYDHAQSWPALLDDPELADRIVSGYVALIRQARDRVATEVIDPDLLTFERLIDLRYARQSSEITIRVPDDIEAASIGPVLSELFHVEHERLYGYRRDSEPVVVVNLRLKARAPARTTSFQEIGQSFLLAARRAEVTGSMRPVYFGPELGEHETRVLDRPALLGRECPGPAIIEEFSTTVVVPPSWQASLDPLGDIILERA